MRGGEGDHGARGVAGAAGATTRGVGVVRLSAQAAVGLDKIEIYWCLKTKRLQKQAEFGLIEN